MTTEDIRVEGDRRMMKELKGQLPMTVSQNVREIDLITKPNELQKQ